MAFATFLRRQEVACPGKNEPVAFREAQQLDVALLTVPERE